MTHPPPWSEQLALTGRGAPEYFRSPAELDGVAGRLALAQALRRAWEVMDLDGVLCIDGAPLIYFKELPRHDPTVLADLHKAAWNNGLAPLLVAVTPHEVRVYSSLALPAKRAQDVDSPNQRLVRLFDRVADALDLLHLVRAVELGEFFQTHQAAFDINQRVDAFLLDNLDAARYLLSGVGGGVLSPRGVHALLGRIVFTCYLVDRRVITREYFAAIGAPAATSLLSLLESHTAEQGRSLLYALFRRLRRDFNGDVFGTEIESEEARVTVEHIEVLRRFLRGDSLVTGQVSLGFWAYNFRVIPIETISAIYEQALEAEGELELGEEGEGYRRKKGAFYTPRHLAQVAVDVALERRSQPLAGQRILDPACGSGIFLVTMFNLLAEQWQRGNPDAANRRRFDGLSSLLTENLFGVDESAAACGVAALSLYLCLLDRMSPPDIQELQRDGSLLPRLVHDPKDPERTGHSIFVANFFEETLPLPEERFDIIIGNPPWASVEPDDKMVLWCERRQLPLAQYQLAYGFVWKAAQHVGDTGAITLLLPAATLHNSQEKALAFVRHWLTTHTVETIVNLSDLRFILFRDAVRPTIIARYGLERPDVRSASLEYVVPKAEPASLTAEILTIAPEDLAIVRLRDALPHRGTTYRRGRFARAELPGTAWNDRLWGTARDRRLLDRLRDFPPLMSPGADASAPDRWILQEGYNKGGKGSLKHRQILADLPHLPSAWSYAVPSRALEDSAPVTVVAHCPQEALFRAPHVVFPHGAPERGGRLVVAFSSRDFTFSHSLRGLSGPPADRDLLCLVACVLSSPLAVYFLFHSAGSWGSERPKIHVSEYATFPFPRPDTPDRVRVVQEVAALHRALEDVIENSVLASPEVEVYARRLDELVYRYYDIDDWERALIEDTVQIAIPSATPRRHSRRAKTSNPIPTLRVSTTEQRRQYRTFFADALNSWANRESWQFVASTVVYSAMGLGVIRVQRLPIARVEPGTEVESAGELDAVLGRLRARLGAGSGSVRRLRHLKVFDGADLVLVKPLALRYWTRTAALNDADEVAAAILTAGHE